MKLTLAISPCPNDTFMFDAMLNGRIDTRGLEFTAHFADIEELNRGVMSAKNAPQSPEAPDISKISYAVLPLITDRYTLLESGSALGHGNGPLLVARPGFRIPTAMHASPSLRIAIPGIHTTANLLLHRLFPQLTNKIPILFSDIAQAVSRGDFDAGVLIHEGRFTYRDHGLELIADLGAEWESATAKSIIASAGSKGELSSRAGQHGLPLPLGAIVASRNLPAEIIRTIEEVLRESIRYAFAHPEKSREFIKSHAQEMDNAVIDSHISLFVNEYSLSLGPEGRRAVRELTGGQAPLRPTF